jgi:hypothetical protein
MVDTMTYALVRDGIVENVIVLDPAMLEAVPETKTRQYIDGPVVVVPGRPAWKPPEGTSLHPFEGAAEIGWQWNDGAPAPVPLPPDVALRQAKERALGEVASAVEAATNAGLKFNGKMFQIDPVSQNRIMALALFARACLDGGETWPADSGWIATDNTRPLFTAQQFWDFAVEAMARVAEITLTARARKDAVIAAKDIDAVNAVDLAI